MPASLRRLMIALAATIAILVVKAFVALPLIHRGIAGRGLYHTLSIWQFEETALVTFAVILFIARRPLQLAWPWAIAIASSAVLSNFGLMVIDARWQEFQPAIEAAVTARFGPPLQILSLGLTALAAGLGGFLAIWWAGGFGDR